MDDDIVTRLRGWAYRMTPTPLILDEAADEIERLRQQIEDLEEEFTETVAWLHSKIQKLINQHISWDTLKEFKTLSEALLEIQRLRAHIALSEMVTAAEEAGMYSTDDM